MSRTRKRSVMAPGHAKSMTTTDAPPGLHTTDADAFELLTDLISAAPDELLQGDDR
jgi:hypothetical protein